MLIVERLASWRGQDVLDNAGEKAGRLEEVYYDATRPEPVLISIKRGRLGHQVKLAPLSDAAVSRDYVRLPFSSEQLGGTPDVDIGDELTAEQCAAVCALFAVQCPSSGPLTSSSLLARRNEEAGHARLRADESELAASERQREAEEARRSGRRRSRGSRCRSARRVSLKRMAAPSSWEREGRCVSDGTGRVSLFSRVSRRREASQAVWRRCWWSFWRLWAAASSRHSDLTADRPRREKRRKPRLLLIWPNTGSTMPWRLR